MRRLSKWLPLVLVIAATGAAFAAEGGPAEHAQQKDSLAGAIMGHIEDSSELEFQSPTGGQALFHLPQIRIPLHAGACPADAEEPASLGKGCLDISITKHVVMMWIAAAFLLLAFLLGAHTDKQKLVPRGASANLLEMLVLFVRNEMAIPAIGKKEGPRFVPYILSVFFFILFMNLLGILPWMSTPTGNVSVTCGLAICTFVLTEIAGIRSAGLKGYVAHLSGGAPLWLLWLMVPIEILGKFTKPFALTIRLFANMIAGHIVIFSLFALIFIFKTVAMSAVAIPFALFIYLLEIFVAFVQAYIFALLSAVFIGMAVAMGHHGDHPEAHGHPGEQLGT